MFLGVLSRNSLSVSTSKCFQFASLQLPRFLPFLTLISFYYREAQGYRNLNYRYYTIIQGKEKLRDTKLKLSTRTMGILVCLGTDVFGEIRRGV